MSLYIKSRAWIGMVLLLFINTLIDLSACKPVHAIASELTDLALQNGAERIITTTIKSPCPQTPGQNQDTLQLHFYADEDTRKQICAPIYGYESQTGFDSKQRKGAGLDQQGALEQCQNEGIKKDQKIKELQAELAKFNPPETVKSGSQQDETASSKPPPGGWRAMIAALNKDAQVTWRQEVANRRIDRKKRKRKAEEKEEKERSIVMQSLVTLMGDKELGPIFHPIYSKIVTSRTPKTLPQIRELIKQNGEQIQRKVKELGEDPSKQEENPDAWEALNIVLAAGVDSPGWLDRTKQTAETGWKNTKDKLAALKFWGKRKKGQEPPAEDTGDVRSVDGGTGQVTSVQAAAAQVRGTSGQSIARETADAATATEGRPVLTAAESASKRDRSQSVATESTSSGSTYQTGGTVQSREQSDTAPVDVAAAPGPEEALQGLETNSRQKLEAEQLAEKIRGIQEEMERLEARVRANLRECKDELQATKAQIANLKVLPAPPEEAPVAATTSLAEAQEKVRKCQAELVKTQYELHEIEEEKRRAEIAAASAAAKEEEQRLKREKEKEEEEAQLKAATDKAAVVNGILDASDERRAEEERAAEAASQAEGGQSSRSEDGTAERAADSTIQGADDGIDAIRLKELKEEARKCREKLRLTQDSNGTEEEIPEGELSLQEQLERAEEEVRKCQQESQELAEMTV